jgi:hypothetical protein
MAHRTGVLSENSAPARANVELSDCTTDWSFPLVRGSDSQRLPSASEALGDASGARWGVDGRSMSNRDSSTIAKKSKSAAQEKRFVLHH